MTMTLEQVRDSIESHLKDGDLVDRYSLSAWYLAIDAHLAAQPDASALRSVLPTLERFDMHADYDESGKVGPCRLLRPSQWRPCQVR